MFSRLRNAVSGAVESLDTPRNALPRVAPGQQLPHKHKYTRPSFLHLSDDAVIVSKDKKVRPVLSASSSNPLPFNTGYAECVNAGKSNLNEDMAQINHSVLHCKISDTEEGILHYAYYSIFDGHAGFGAALDASKQLHHIIHQKLVDSMDAIFGSLKDPFSENIVDTKSLIVGCLETAFCEMDELIKESRQNYYNPGGCTAIVALFIVGNVFVANAGDCRAGICQNDKFIPMSNDYSPYYDKIRIYRKAYENPDLLGEKYSIREFVEIPMRDDLGKNVLYRDPYMTGWSFKTLGPEDLKLPLISGIGRRSRIMGTIGVARGFGDFDLTANHHKTPIKPFLSCVPEVKVYPLKDISSPKSVLVMASDGLWDAVNVDDVVETCRSDGAQSVNDRNRNVLIAMNLVAAARGRKDDVTNMWFLKNASTASLDDISVFVVPFEPFLKTDEAFLNYKIVSTNKEKSAGYPSEVSDTESGSTPPTTPRDESGYPECDYSSIENGIKQISSEKNITDTSS